MEAKHTPGPWFMDGPTLKCAKYNIGSVNSHRTTEGTANAQLISAAPELLAALEEVVTTFSCVIHAGLISKYTDLIAKAKGAK
jgi:hypothetical protein